MHLILIGFACLHFAVSRSVIDPPVQPVGIETNGLCSTVRCANGQTCRLMPNQNCTENCELFARCVTDNTSVLNGTLPSNGSSTGSCPPNQERQACGSSCEPTCAQPVVEMCDERCNVNVCRCKAGYVKDVSGNCIQQSQCPNISVITPLPLTCANMLCTPGYVCTQIQINCLRAPCPQPAPECVPVDGSNGNQNQSCPANEVWNSCGNVCEKTCATRNNGMCPLICMANGACECQKGYVRQNGVCIPASQCPTAADPGECKANETYTECGSSCEPSCSNPIPEMCTAVCIIGCQCQGGFMRNSSGACVAQQDCSTEQPTSTCANVKCTADTECKMIDTLFCKKEPCPQTPKCVPRSNPTIAPPPKCNLFCPEGQRCELQEVQCFAVPCNPIPHCVNETIAVDPPGSSCALVDCVSGSICTEEPLECFAPPCPTEAKCIPQGNATCDTMQCADGFICELDNGVPSCVYNGPSSCAATLCITGSQCVEEELPCLQAPCPTRAKCVANNSTDGPIPLSLCAATTCPAGSDCLEEEVACFVAPCEKQARCVPANGTTGATCENIRLKCHAGEQCGMVNGSPTCVPGCAINETYRECSSCEQQCGQELMMCPAVCGPPKCQCENGFSRTTLGNCVLDAECSKNDVAEDPPTSSSCAATSCPVGSVCVEEDVPCFVAPCPKQARCGPANNTNEVSCDNVRLRCTEGQECGMVHGSPTCVPVCALNETFTDCFGCEHTCAIDMTSCAAECRTTGCQCNFGYSRNSSGLCIQKEDCPTSDQTLVCGTVKCKEGYTCTIILGTPKCEARDTTSEEDDDDNETKCKKNEAFDGCGGCESTCENENPVCAMACMPGKCACVPGFVRLNGKCVTYDKCDKIVDTDPVCGPNEDYTECMPSCESNCRGDRCSDGNNSTMTIALCTPGCVCKPFYKRDHAGVCRHNRHCYSHAGCGKNEEWSRCRKCEQTCGETNNVSGNVSHPSSPFSTCDNECKDDPGCRCKDGFARDSDGHCVDSDTGC